MKNHYQTLGVHPTADTDTIKNVFRSLAQKYHPDRKTGDLEKFQAINEAYQVLDDPERRKQYDETGCGDERRDLLMPILSSLLFQVISASDVLHDDIIARMREYLNEQCTKGKRAIEKLEIEIKKLEAFNGRISVNDGAENILLTLTTGQIQIIKGAIAMQEEQITNLDGIKDILDGMSYQIDQGSAAQDIFSSLRRYQSLAGGNQAGNQQVGY